MLWGRNLMLNYQAKLNANALLTACWSDSSSVSGSYMNAFAMIPINPTTFICMKINLTQHSPIGTPPAPPLPKNVNNNNNKKKLHNNKITWKCLRYISTAIACDSNMLCMAIRGSMLELPEEQFPKGFEQWPGGYFPLI